MALSGPFKTLLAPFLVLCSSHHHENKWILGDTGGHMVKISKHLPSWYLKSLEKPTISPLPTFMWAKSKLLLYLNHHISLWSTCNSTQSTQTIPTNYTKAYTPLVFLSASTRHKASSWILSSTVFFPIPIFHKIMQENCQVCFHISPLLKTSPIKTKQMLKKIPIFINSRWGSLSQEITSLKQKCK